MRKANKGITLIALIITVIVMLILAAVVINLTIGENGIIKKTQEAAIQYKIAELEERINIAIAEYATYMEKETLYRILSKIKGLESISPDNEVEGPPYNLIIEGYEFIVKEDLTVQYVKQIDSSILPEIDSVRKVGETDKQVTLEIKASTKDSLGLKEIRIIKNGVEVDKIEDLNGREITTTYNIIGNGTYKITVIAKNGTQATSEEIEITTLKTTSGTIQEGSNINGQVTLTVKADSQEEIKKVYVYDSSNKLIDEIACSGTKIEKQTKVEIAFYESKTYHAEIETDYGRALTNNVTVKNEEYIKTETDLKKLAEIVNGGTSFAEKKSIKQVADITLSQNHIVIGKEGYPFNGIYNGQGYSIKNVVVNGTTDYDYGIFGYVEGSEEKFAEISNLTVEGNIVGTYDVGGIVGRINYANVTNCTNKAEVKSTKGERLSPDADSFLSATGGIVGRIGTQGNSQIKNCKNYATITGVQEGIGGIAGWARNGSIVDCENNADINNNTLRIGGIIGGGITAYDKEDIRIYRCTNNGNISGKAATGGIIGISGAITIQGSTNNGEINAIGNVGNGSLVGGIIGEVMSVGECNNVIYQCTNNAIVKGISNRVGGIVGVMREGRIEECINNNEVEGNVWTAGICGDAGNYIDANTITAVTITKCKNTKAVTGIYDVGGIVGILRRNSVIEQACNTGDITSTKYDSDNNARTGGIAGAAGGNNTISYCYNTGNIVSQNRAVGGLAGLIASNAIGLTNVSYCYNTGDITNNGTQYTGRTSGIIGNKFESASVNVTNCWYLKDCVKKGTDNDKVGGTEKTETEIKALTWTNFIKDGVNNGGYPILSWEKE